MEHKLEWTIGYDRQSVPSGGFVGTSELPETPRAIYCCIVQATSLSPLKAPRNVVYIQSTTTSTYIRVLVRVMIHISNICWRWHAHSHMRMRLARPVGPVSDYVPFRTEKKTKSVSNERVSISIPPLFICAARLGDSSLSGVGLSWAYRGSTTTTTTPRRGPYCRNGT